MNGFRYKHGDRPLEGYTIQRGAGRGGFGEVYYALSDSGREVALKVISGYQQIELRGVSQCMNLKNPHLVSIFDIRFNDQGTPFVIMEFVGGPSLRQIIDDAPAGLGAQKAAFFLREMGKGLTFLHDCGIVHRDLKPGNIFFENGYVKIGDYGLSKAMAATQHSGQTVTVGTVHYMAPEIGLGRYDRSIDIYALGAVLYEMLTGQPPYLGASAGEILMKHMSAAVDVTGIDEPFATVIKRAMAKDPADRYASVQEMVEAVFGAEHVRQSVSVFSPDALSMVAARVPLAVGAGAAVGGGSSGPMPQEPPPFTGPSDVWQRMGHWVDRAGNRITTLGSEWAAGDVLLPDAQMHAAGRDPIPLRQRRMLACLALVLLTASTGLLMPFGTDRDRVAALLFSFFAALGAGGGILWGYSPKLARLNKARPGWRRLAVAGFAVVLSLPALLMAQMAVYRTEQYLLNTWWCVLIPVALMSWPRVLGPTRPRRVSFWHAVLCALLGWLLAAMFTGIEVVAIATLAAISLSLQILHPWDPAARRVPAVPFARRLVTPFVNVHHDAPPPPPVRPAAPEIPAPALAPSAAATQTLYRTVPAYARWIWLGVMTLLLSLGPVLIYAGSINSAWRTDDALLVAFGVGTLLLAVLCFFRALTRRFRGWTRYLLLPLGQYAAAQTVLITGIMLGNVRLNSDEWLIALFFLIFSCLALVILLALAMRPAPRAGAPAAPSGPPAPPHVPAPSPVPGEPAAPPAPRADLSRSLAPVATVLSGVRSFSPVRFVLNVVGSLLLLCGFLVGLSVAADLPGLINSGFADSTVSRDLSRLFNTDQWPPLAQSLGNLLQYALFFLAGVALMLARRRTRGDAGSLAHVPLALVGFLVGLHMIDKAFPSWPYRTAMDFQGQFEQWSKAIQPGWAIWALVVLFVSLLILLQNPDATRKEKRP